jgi:hypothetical protein
LTTRWLVAIAAGLLVGTAVGQEASAVSKGKQTPAVSKPQLDASEPDDGTEFASSYKRNQPQAFPVKELIPGWSQALQLMPVGSKWQLFIPPQLGYAERVMGPIGPNAMLTYEVELISIQDKPPTVSAQ